MTRRRPVPVLIALLAAACARRTPSAESAPVAADLRSVEQASALGYQAGQGAHAASAPARMSAPAAAPAPPPAPNQAPRSPAALKLIWTASLQVEVPNFRAAADEAGRAAAALGGYVSDRQSAETGTGRERGTLTLRIPSERFDGAMGAFRKLGRVRSETVQTQDVTRAYSDLETRLKVKRETAARLREILTRQTGKVSEVLEVEREIARVVEEIEQAEGERRYFDNQVALSTITLSLHEPDALVSPGAFDPVAAALRQALRIMGESLGALIELLAGLLPWAAALYLAFRAVLWRLRRKR